MAAETLAESIVLILRMAYSIENRSVVSDDDDTTLGFFLLQVKERLLEPGEVSLMLPVVLCYRPFFNACKVVCKLRVASRDVRMHSATQNRHLVIAEPSNVTGQDEYRSGFGDDEVVLDTLQVQIRHVLQS